MPMGNKMMSWFFGVMMAVTMLVFNANADVSFQDSTNQQNRTLGVSLLTQFSAEEISQLENAEPVVRVERDTSERNAAAHIVGAISIDASPKEIWAAMVDCELAPEFVPNLVSCEITEEAEDGSYDIRRHIISFSFLGFKVENIFRSDYMPYDKISFHLVGGDLKRQEGAWTIIPQEDGQTIVIYEAYVALGKPVPRFMVRRGMRKDMPEVLIALREQVLNAQGITDAQQ